MKTKNDHKKVLAEITNASKTSFKLTHTTVVSFIMICVEYAIGEICNSGKLLYGYTRKSLIDMASAHIEECKSNVTYKSDSRLMLDYFATITDYIWSLVNNAEAQHIISKLKTDEEWARRFFYNVKGKHLNMVSSLRLIQYKVNSAYGAELSLDYVSTIVYTKFMLEKECLNTFNFSTSIFVWLRKIARQAVVKRLEEEGYVHTNKETTVGNTRLTLKSKSAEFCKLVIDCNVEEPQAHKLLTTAYVERKSVDDAALIMGMSVEGYEASLYKAEELLRSRIINSAESYEGALGSKVDRTVIITGEAAEDIMKWVSENESLGGLHDCFGTNLTKSQISERAVALMKELESGMKWSERDRKIWQERYWNDTPTKEFADEIACSVGYIDTRYNRMKRKYEHELRLAALKFGIISQQQFDEIELRLKLKKNK